MINRKRVLIALTLILVASLGGVFYLWELPHKQSATETSSPSLQDLASLDQLMAAFRSDSGKVRLISLLSPT